MQKIRIKLIWLVFFLVALALVSTVGVRSQSEGTILRAEVYEWGIDLANSNLPAGPATLFVTNVGAQAHGFALEGPGAGLRFPRQLQPGETQTMWVELQPGAYRLYDPFGGSDRRGVSAEFSVGGGQGQAGGQASLTPGAQPGQTATAAPTQGAQPGQGATGTPAAGEGQPATGTPAPGGQQGGDGQALIQQGEEVFANNCATCHGQDGQGGVGPALAGNGFVTSEDPMPVIDTVLHGRGQMPAFQGQLSSEQIASVVSYIRNAWDNQASTVSPDQVGDGQGQAGDGQGQAGGQTATPAAPQVELELVANNRRFSTETLSVPPGALVTLTFTNRDRFPHNVAVYEDATAQRPLFIGRIFTGPSQTVTYQFTAPATPGTYFFRCDVHPFMNGDFIVEQE